MNLLANCIAVFLGSGIGGVLRFLISNITIKWFQETRFPIGTVFVNSLGSLVLGLLIGYFSSKINIDDSSKLFFTVGLCGGFTTFSTMMGDGVRLLQNSMLLSGICYLIGSVVLGLFLFYIGYSISK